MYGVLDDWSDEPARKILEMQKGVMTPGYSTLLTHELHCSQGPGPPSHHGVRSDYDGDGGGRGEDRVALARVAEVCWL